MLDTKSMDLLVECGPRRDNSLNIVPWIRRQNPSLHNITFFLGSSKYYTCYLENGEKCDKPYLVYSKELDRILCSCCKLFKRDPQEVLD